MATETGFERTARQFPTVHVTLISIVVALMLERLLGTMAAIDRLWTLSLSGALAWIQVLLYVNAAIQVWTHACLFSTSVRSSPAMGEFLQPFVMLFLFDGMLVLMQRGDTGWWFILTGLMYFTAPIAWRRWERVHEGDDTSAHGLGAYRAARRLGSANGSLMIVGGVPMLAGLGGSWIGVVCGSAGLVFSLLSHREWLRGWKRAVGAPA